MRPERLELEGFGPFRERTEVDFSGCDLLAFVGPTGSGKTSLVDAMVFALYGSIPRYDRRQVGAVVTKGALAGRVRLDFTLGSEEYTVARSVRIDARGKVTTEARLEKGVDVLAGSVREVDAAMEGLLGLTFDQFTKCVVLPQGEFSGFLHARPSERGDLLVALLDLGVFDRVAESARIRQAQVEGQVSAIEAGLAAGPEVDPDSLTALEARVAGLESLLRGVEEGAEELASIVEEQRQAQVAAESLVAKLKTLQVAPPPGLDDLTARLGELRRSLEEATERLAASTDQVTAAEERIEKGPDRVSLSRYAELWGQKNRLEESVSQLIEADAASEEALVAASRSLETAMVELERLRRAHEADHLRSGLTAGEPCPVCEQVVARIPATAGPGPLADAERQREEESRRHSKADRARAAAATELSSARSRLEELAGSLADAPLPERITAELERLSALEAGLKEARSARQKAADTAAAARSALDGLAEAEKKAKLGLQEALVALGGLDPPSLDLDDLAGSWKALLRFVAAEKPAVESGIVAAKARLDDLRATVAARQAAIVESCRESGIATTAQQARDAVFRALTEARSDVSKASARLEEIARLTERRSELISGAATARALAGHLKANRFEKWLLDEALRVLASGANRRLGELAGGQYSLALDSQLDFEVVDHHAADERRSVASLSGGETFLVSLALALSLADHIAAMSAVGTSRLEAIFLDEGFGTLDPEALEAAATVIADIGAGGKMVGIITHVRELSEMVPVRFEVTKSASGARVRRARS